ncbi:cupin domain-containing protein [Variovorax sp. Sphag1AA]|uniref:cupin domain-containing protein n=1 Tax=Variovorax sp. Sphag1AA TaxID=2587027 RepID=UPI001606F4D8|nr:cupin domain-containing protein [Variovorax sp. Sphag1AA]MBB3180841.1 quercetin dioxygenase-like cupin family protein [Variovorax sp. Sphag1AA]
MALEHAAPGEPRDVRPFGSALADQKTQAIFKSRQLEVMRLVLRAGRKLPPHKVPGEITIHCIEGTMIVGLDSGARRLEAGQILFLQGDEMHDVSAESDASALVTIVLRDG